MGFEDGNGQIDGVHRVKSEMVQYDEYDAYSNAMMNGDFRGDFNPGMANFSDAEAQFNQAASVDVASQIFMDAERMAQLEREFHEQVCVYLYMSS